MRTAETILTVIRERGIKGLPLERVYRLLFNQDLYLRAYAKLYPNKGAMTKGITNETVDGMSLVKINQLIDDLRHERHRWTPVRRVHIPKTHGKMRPLGLPTWKDKLLQEVLRTILEAYYEPQFNAHAHGFRPHRGCHTALQEIQHTWRGTKWFIEGDIAQYFDTIDHDRLITILSNHIHDGRFLRLIRELLKAGYMEQWKFKQTFSGTPQGGVISPLLSNIYLHEFDQWVTNQLIPAHTMGHRRRVNPAYSRMYYQIKQSRARGDISRTKRLVHQRRQLPAVDPHDPHYRRLIYIRYADDFLLGFAGPHSEAEIIKDAINAWLRDTLNLTLSDDKTLITHATTQAARFLGYEISVMHANDKLDARKHRSINGGIELRIPATVVEQRCARYCKNGVVYHRPELLAESDYTIVTRYQQTYRGIVQYYLPAHNVKALGKLRWIMEASLLKTLAQKHKRTVSAMWKKYAATTQTPDGSPLKCLEVRVERANKPPLIARFGGISLARQPLAILTDQPWIDKVNRTELLQRLLADSCELCGSKVDIEVHHIRKLANLKKRGRKEKPLWMQTMIARQRKTLVVCRTCHWAIHTGKPTRQRVTE